MPIIKSLGDIDAVKSAFEGIVTLDHAFDNLATGELVITKKNEKGYQETFYKFDYNLTYGVCSVLTDRLNTMSFPERSQKDTMRIVLYACI